MDRSTDETIEIKCQDCDNNDLLHVETGVQAMFEHILESHPNYNEREADVMALEWMEQAFDKEDLFLENYYKERKEDPSE